MSNVRYLRKARLEDLYYVVPFIMDHFEESPYSHMTFSTDKIFRQLEAMVEGDPRDYLVLVSVDRDDLPVGVFVAQRIQPTFSEEYIGVELDWYLLPAYRRGRRALEFIKAFEYWARAVGCKSVQYSRLSSSPEGVSKFYERLGAKPVEFGYQKVL